MHSSSGLTITRVLHRFSRDAHRCNATANSAVRDGIAKCSELKWHMKQYSSGGQSLDVAFATMRLCGLKFPTHCGRPGII